MGEFNTRKMSRHELAIVYVLFDSHPIPMTEEEITQQISALGLLEMTDEEFAEYREKVRVKKQN